MLGEQDVSVEVEVADDRRVASGVSHAASDLGHGLGRVVGVDGDADELGSGLGELDDLRRGRLGIDGVGVRHRLDDDGGAAADLDVADGDADGAATLGESHVVLTPSR